jgi:hypothetical protein
MTRALAILALALLLPAAAPLAAGSTTYPGVHAPVDPDCATDPGGDETMRIELDGELAFPGEGCMASFSKGNATDVKWVRFRMMGDVRPGCGFFAFTGAFVGRSDVHCAPDSSNITAFVDVDAGAGTRFNVTWHPLMSPHHNAYLCGVGTLGPDPEPPAPPCMAWTDDTACMPGMEAEAGAGKVTVDWPDFLGASSHIVVAARTEAGAQGSAAMDSGVRTSSYTFTLEPGTYAFAVASLDADGGFVGAVCEATATVAGEGGEVPFFGSPWAIGAGLAAVVVAGVLLARRK